MIAHVFIRYNLLVLVMVVFPPGSEGKAGVMQRTFRGTCEGFLKNVSRLENVHIKRQGAGVLMSFDFVVIKDFKNDIKVSLESQKCKGNDALDTCENTRVFTINNNCKLLNGEPWKAFALAANPPLRCPLKKMTHLIRNVTVGVPAFFLLPLGNGYYKTKVIFRDQITDEFIMCVYGESQLYSYSTD
ncbi:uncharacterized protein [Leptinotarsa decemlineata]|uniref:uncharacterized protein n=1 Tax=Leptinotarsa decemlineata TaxID=7539 RepID=UPI003D304D5B